MILLVSNYYNLTIYNFGSYIGLTPDKCVVNMETMSPRVRVRMCKWPLLQNHGEGQKGREYGVNVAACPSANVQRDYWQKLLTRLSGKKHIRNVR